MTWGAKIGLVVVIVLLLVGAAGGLWYYDVIDFGPSGPDRSDAVRAFLEKALFDNEGLEIVSCKQVRSPMIDNVRQEYPTFEVVDCVFRHRNPLGGMMEETHHFWILDGKVIYELGGRFKDAHGHGSGREADIKRRIEENRNKAPGGGPPPGMMKGKQGKQKQADDGGDRAKQGAEQMKKEIEKQTGKNP